MWNEGDTFGRWVQGLCAIPLLAWACFVFYLMAISRPFSYSRRTLTAEACSGIVAAYLAFRCLRYAVTGRGNINRDDD